jgi:hypothetical protein
MLKISILILISQIKWECEPILRFGFLNKMVLILIPELIPEPNHVQIQFLFTRTDGFNPPI